MPVSRRILSWERNFSGTVQNSAYDLQKLYTATRLCDPDNLKKCQRTRLEFLRSQCLDPKTIDRS